MTKISIFASGSGSNAEQIIKYFEDSKEFQIDSIFCNNKNAYVLQRAKKHNIDTVVFTKADFETNDIVLKKLQERKIDLVVLAGFLLKVPDNIINAYPNKIINIHPALLPKYGGKGMYGLNVHKAVVNAKEKESGITIHFVDGIYDNGKIIFQAKCKVSKNDTPEEVALKVHQLEHKYFPQMIESIGKNNLKKI